MFILETAAQDPDSAVAWIGVGTGIVTALIVFWGKLKTLYQSISETFTNREATRRELAVLAEQVDVTAKKVENMLKEQKTIADQMRDIGTNYQVGIEKITAMREILEREHEDITTMQQEVKDLQKDVAEIKGRLSK